MVGGTMKEIIMTVMFFIPGPDAETPVVKIHEIDYQIQGTMELCYKTVESRVETSAVKEGWFLHTCKTREML